MHRFVKIEDIIVLWTGRADDEACTTSTTRRIRREAQRKLDLRLYLEHQQVAEHEEGGAREA